MSQILIMMIPMMIIIVVSKIENICGRRPLPPIISHSFPLSNSALSSIGSRSRKFNFTGNTSRSSIRSRSRSMIALTSKNTTTTVLSAAHRGETNHQQRQKLFFIALSVQDALFYCQMEKSGFSSSLSSPSLYSSYQRPHNHYEHQNHHHHCQLDHLGQSRGDNDVPSPLFTVIRYPTQFFTILVQ